ncbi:hypothetical protein JMJ35_004345 [Cladonia borealis]|uniref:AB hydrolase-1 domain-containing protein n=1 Tax=Cladonia borealis TaxID=184061 RepID=A0AA39V610_9LECA|nr:hypothetical protein JMJ35_004345 [Cladonia borealis]
MGSIRVISSPRETLIPSLSESQAAALPYPPNLLPGARDVKTPYVHGDTTPAPILEPIAAALVQLGCRVMIIDLWGRGYSDSPIGVPYDTRLFLIIFFRYPWLTPFSYSGKLVGNILGLYHTGAASKVTRIEDSSTALDALQELQRTAFESPNVVAIAQWQIDNHQGFVRSFVNTVKHGPIMHQQSEWSNICEVIRGITPPRSTATLAKHVEFRTFPSDHEVPSPSSAEAIKHISEFWNLNLVS